MIDATHLKAHRTADSLPKKGLFRGLSTARQSIANAMSRKGDEQKAA